MSSQKQDLPTRRMFVFGIVGGTIASCFVPQWHSVKYNYDYTVLNHLNYGYVKLRRNGLMIGGSCVLGALTGYATRNKKFD